MSRLHALHLLDATYAIVRLPAGTGLPWWVAASDEFLSYSRSASETSIVCDTRRVPDGVQAERGYRALRVEGTLPFQETGVLVALATPLAAAGVPIFVVSTFDTDYLLVAATSLAAALDALRNAGHTVSEGNAPAEQGGGPRTLRP